VRDDRVAQAELDDHLAQEPNPLRAALDQRERALRLGDRERQTGQPGPRADVGDSVAAQQRLEREALDEMPFDELLFVANTREVVDAVSADQEIEEPRERLAVRFRQLEARGAQAPPDVGRRQRSFDARHRRSMPPRALESVSVICAWVICAGLRAPR